MTRRILKSLLVLTVVLATAGTAARAQFTSNVTAADNVIEVGTLRSGVGTTTDVTGSGTAYTVVYDNDGTETQVAYFPVLENMQPSNYGQNDEERSVYMVVYNRGTLPFNYRFTVNGSWVGGGGTPSYMQLRHVHRYASNDWEGEWGPLNIRSWLNGVGYSWETGVTANTWNYSSGLGLNNWFNDSSSVGSKKYQIYKLTFGLSSSAGNGYQGRSYQYSVSLGTKQTNASW